METKIEWTRINNDTNGNPRYVCHFYNLLTQDELERKMYDDTGRMIFPSKYEIAVKRANKLGGRKFHNKQYGGGIVFQSYNLHDTEQYILKATEKITEEENK